MSSPDKIADYYKKQQTRMQITEDWKDACLMHELQEVEKLERFVEEERQRAHNVAYGLMAKQQEAEARRANLMEMKRQRQLELKARNAEMASRAGNKAEEMRAGDMEAYERKQELIK